MIQWFVSRDEKRAGPFTEDAVRAYVKAGKLRKTDLVWRTGDPGWQPAGAIPGLFGRMPGALDPRLVPAPSAQGRGTPFPCPRSGRGKGRGWG